VTPIDHSEHPLVGALSVIIKKYSELNPETNDTEVLECLAYVHACIQRYSKGTPSHKLN
jgi:hypothetical protein